MISPKEKKTRTCDKVAVTGQKYSELTRAGDKGK